MVRNEGCCEGWSEIPPKLCLICFNRNLLKAGCDANKTNQGKRTAFLVACAVWEMWCFGSAVILVTESKETKPSHLRTRIMPWLMRMGLSHGFAWTLAVCLQPGTCSSPLTCFSIEDDYGGGLGCPQSWQLISCDVCHKSQGPLSLQAPSGSSSPGTSVGCCQCDIPALLDHQPKQTQGLCIISTSTKRLRKSGKIKIRTLNRTRSSLTFF